MKEINFDGFVLDMYDGDYSCARWCYGCNNALSSNLRTDLDIWFIKKVCNYLKEYNIHYESISLNMFWDIFHNIGTITKGLYIFLKLWLLRSGHTLLFYSSLEDKDIVDFWKVKHFCNIFSKYFYISIGFDFDIGKGMLEIEKNLDKLEFIYTQLSNISEISLRIILQRPQFSKLSAEEKGIIYKRLTRLNILYDILLSEYEGANVWKGSFWDIEFYQIFQQEKSSKCPFLASNNIEISSDVFKLWMLNISDESFRFHWPYCLQVDDLNIWSFTHDPEQIEKQTKEIILRINALELKHEKSNWLENICSFCIKNL